MNKARKSMIILGIAVIGLMICSFIAIQRHRSISFDFEDSSTLLGATEINPAVMYDGAIYYWKCMYGSGNREMLPDDYEYEGDIINIREDNLEQNFQFTGKFDATGQLFYSEKDPNNIYVLMKTDWIDNRYVIFSKKSD